MSELEDAKVSSTPSYAQVKKLPYLGAVIKESMRIYPTPNWPMERKVPAGGATICGKYFEEGTSVGCLPSAVHFNPDTFSSDAEAFRPERWLEAGEDELRAMEAAHLGFSRGRRVCLGQHIAVLQMKKVIPAILINFDVSVNSNLAVNDYYLPVRLKNSH